MKSSTSHWILLLVTLVLLTATTLLSGCGKAGDPRPPKSSRAFAWQNVDIEAGPICLDVAGRLSGMYTNLETVVLELYELNSAEDCPGCPFLATESFDVPNLKDVFDPNTGMLRFSYCPKNSATAYRYRLIGKNIHQTTRHAVSGEGFLVMP